MGDTKKIVVIGGGFAGLEFVKRLGNLPKFQIVLVDSNNYNFFPPSCHALIPPENVLIVSNPFFRNTESAMAARSPL